MPSPSYKQDLLDKIRALPEDKIVEVIDFVEFLHTRRGHQPVADTLEALEAKAAAAGLLRLPDPQAHKRSTTEAPPVTVSGRPPSEIVIEDRR